MAVTRDIKMHSAFAVVGNLILNLLSRPISLIIHTRSLPSDNFRSISEFVVSFRPPPPSRVLQQLTAKSTRPTLQTVAFFIPEDGLIEPDRERRDHVNRALCVMTWRCE